MGVSQLSRCPIRRTMIVAALCGVPAAAQPAATDITLKPGTELPQADAPIDLGLCRHHGVEPRTAAGQVVGGAGWAVTDEEPLGALTAVSFVAGSRSMTSGACVLSGGRVGIFDGAELLALVEDSQPGGTAIAHLRRSGDRLRIWDGAMLSRPVADIMLAENVPAIVPLPPFDIFCGGALRMPLIHGLTLGDANILLADHGWEQAELAPPSDPIAAELVANGFTGVEHCSGTGFGFCTLSFVQGLATASVLTFGDLNLPAGPLVADYDVTCPDLPSQPG